MRMAGIPRIHTSYQLIEMFRTYTPDDPERTTQLIIQLNKPGIQYSICHVPKILSFDGIESKFIIYPIPEIGSVKHCRRR